MPATCTGRSGRDPGLGQPAADRPHTQTPQVVPTTYTDRSNASLLTNQYSVTEHFRPVPEMSNVVVPGLYFYYDLSPIKVRVPWG